MTKLQNKTHGALLGFGLVWGCYSMVSGGAFSAGNAQEILSAPFMLTTGSVFTAIVIAALSKRLFPLSRYSAVLALVAVIAAAACATAAMLSTGTLAGRVLLCGVYLFLGSALAVFNCAWLEFYVRIGPIHAALILCLSHCVTALCGFVPYAVLVPSTWRLLIAAVYLLIMAVLYRYCCRPHYFDGYLPGERIEGSWSFPVRPVMLVALFASASGLARSGMESDLTNYARLGVVAISLLLYLSFRRGGFERGYGGLANIALCCMVAALACRTLSNAWAPVAATFLANGAYALFFVFTYIMLCQLSYRFGVNPLLLFGTTYAAIKGAEWVMRIIAVSAWETSSNTFVLLCAIAMVLLLIGFLWTTDPKTSEETWGMKPKNKSSLSEQLALESLVDKCARMARSFGLTRREEEILMLLSQGHTIAEIEEELVISRATVKSHVQHTYEKCGVHSKQELLELIESYNLQET